MAELVVSSFLNVLCDKLVSASVASLEKLAPFNEIDPFEIQKLQRSLTQIQDVLVDASQKEITSRSVKRWLNDLQHLAYDIDDVLDGLATEAMQRERELTDEAETHTSKVRKIFSSFSRFNPLRGSTSKNGLSEIATRLQDLIGDIASLGLIVKEEITRPKNDKRRLQTSMVDASRIVGRQAEKEALVHKLLDGESSGQNFSIVPIIGMGGVGKTTLARLLYNEEQVKNHFQYKAWVCVSDDFDSFAISKVIFQSVTGESKHFEDLNLLQVALRDHLREKRFLLVLDDVWSDDCQDWEMLVGPFHACAPGSKIIMTTRKDQLLKKLGYDHLNQLESLSHDDAVSLIALYALGVNNFDSHLSLKPHGEDIARKCNGLPLAVIAIGRLLTTKKDEEEYWKEVLNSEIWELPVESELVPALKLSYHDLSATLKQLFAYCSLFPKDFLFDKEELVLLWMAEGFLHQLSPNDTTEEQRLGHKHFDELMSRSFFQNAPNNESLFVMHDLMNDLATYVANEFFIRLENGSKRNNRMEMLEKYRHMSFVREKYITYKKFEAFERAKCLRTFLATSVGEVNGFHDFYLSNKILTDLLPELSLLRVLSLSGFNIHEVPESICTLRHLRYLNLSKTKITHLPENVCNLYNLQTLILFGCYNLAKLPNNFRKLKDMRHLDVRDTHLLFQMLSGIGELKSLQITISKVIIGSETGFEISKLKHLENLCGKICIEGLEKVQSAIHVHEANLSQKRIGELELVWSKELHDSRNETLEKEVLTELKPYDDKLTQLNIRSYGGLEFPKWVGDPLFLNLKHVSLNDCKRCKSLPPLGKLPSLKELFIKGLNGVEDVDFKLLPATCSFPSLEILTFENMCGWKKWYGVVLPCLQQLIISGCPNLVEVTLEAMPSLNVLEIADCPNLVKLSLEALPSLNDLRITKCHSDVLRRIVTVASTISKLQICDIPCLNDCPDSVKAPLEALLSLNVLYIDKCDSSVLKRLVEIASEVIGLSISSISGLNDVVWKDVIKCLGAVEELSISSCNELRYLVELRAVESKNLVKLRKLYVNHCNNLVSLEEKEGGISRSTLLPSLRILEVDGCKNMERCSCSDGIEKLTVKYCSSITIVSFPKGGLEKLKSLQIRNCSKLMEMELGGQKMNNRSIMPMLEYLRFENWPNLKSIIELNCSVHLTELRIQNCESLESFPANLTSLKRMELRNCTSMDASLPGWVWPPNLRYLRIWKMKKPFSKWGPQKFPTSLMGLYIHGTGEDEVRSCNQISHLLPSSLTYLRISEFDKLESVLVGFQHLTSLQSLKFSYCPNLKKVSSHPQHLTSLQHLTFIKCPKMMDLPELLLPSLLSLDIFQCPNLKERCSKNERYRTLISYIPCNSTSFMD